MLLLYRLVSHKLQLTNWRQSVSNQGDHVRNRRKKGIRQKNKTKEKSRHKII